MILYFADKTFTVRETAGTNIRKEYIVKNDLKEQDIDTGIATFTFDLYYDFDKRQGAEDLTEPGNFVFRQRGEEAECYVIIDTEEDTGKGYINVYAEDADLDLVNEINVEYSASSAMPIASYIEYFATDTGWEIGVNEISNLSRKLSWDGEQTTAARIRSVATQFGAEIGYSFVIDGLSVVHKYINIYKQRGNTNIELRVGRDVKPITIKRSVANLVTALRVKGGASSEEDSESKAITLSGYNYDDGDIYVSGELLVSRSALRKWSRYNRETGLSGNVGHIVGRYSYDTTSQSELCAHAVTKLKSLYDIETTYEAELYTIPDELGIGDTVSITEPDGSLYLTARVLKLSVSETNDSKNVAKLGDISDD